MKKGLLSKRTKMNDGINMAQCKILTNRLYSAIHINNLEEAIYCIDNGAWIDVEGKSTNAVILAAQYGREDILEYILSKGAKVDAQDLMGATALMWASSSNNLKIVDILLEYGADINFPDAEFASTPLMWWVGNCDDDMNKIEYLVRRGADVSYRDIISRSCVEYAEENFYYDVADYLRKEQKIQNILQTKLLTSFDDLRTIYKKISKQVNGYKNYINYFKECYEEVKGIISQGAHINDGMIEALSFCAEYFKDAEMTVLCNKQIEYKRQHRRAITTQKKIKRERGIITE